jgi:hypothetical protein
MAKDYPPIFKKDRPQQDPLQDLHFPHITKYSNRKKEGRGNPAFPPKHQRFK